MKLKKEMEKGFINVHINIRTKEIFASKRPYPTREKADLARFMGIGIEKIGCFEIEYTKI